MNVLADRLRAIATPTPAWLSLIAAIALSVIGLLAIQTAETDSGTRYAADQSVWLVVALAAMFACFLVSPRTIVAIATPAFVVSILLLVLLILPFAPSWLVTPRNGARCWINLHYMSFQPGEFAKIFFVLTIAKYLRFRENYRTLGGLFAPFAIMFVPMALILKQPDLGMTLLFLPALFAILIAAGAKKRHMAALLGIAVVAIVVNIALIYTLPHHPFLKPHQVNRIKAMISQLSGDKRYAMDIGYQQDKSMTLIGSGGVTGYGAERSATIVHFNRLPEDHNDMIFAVIVNRWGLLGGFTVLGLYLMLFLGMLLVAARTKEPFARLVCVGFLGILFCQTLINVGMTIGLMPITGLTLPFVSYGGSSLVTTFLIMGLIANFAAQPRALITRPSFEFDNADAIFQ